MTARTPLSAPRRSVLAALMGVAAAGCAAPNVHWSEGAPTRVVRTGAAGDAPSAMLLVTNSAGRHVSFVEPGVGVVGQVEVGRAPWGAALAPGPAAQRVYVATADGVAVVDTAARERVALVPYRSTLPSGA